VIPREEREVEREKDTAQVNAQVNGDSEVNEIAQIDKDNAPSGLRRSGRRQTPLRYSTPCTTGSTATSSIQECKYFSI
jgi:hypothetical protein